MLHYEVRYPSGQIRGHFQLRSLGDFRKIFLQREHILNGLGLHTGLPASTCQDVGRTAVHLIWFDTNSVVNKVQLQPTLAETRRAKFLRSVLLSQTDVKFNQSGHLKNFGKCPFQFLVLCLAVVSPRVAQMH